MRVSRGGKHKNAANEKRDDGEGENQVKQHEVNDVFGTRVEVAEVAGVGDDPIRIFLGAAWHNTPTIVFRGDRRATQIVRVANV
ncbi:MAG: hypothetical protein A3H64_00230 [Candidatus Ryanbacteria bacterium RIFCSPLOWO2_02_FULL_45_11c]|uniref:Uncharacterized protein n=1 Tax=Candidatus Ryanbacteria bacterium RIFCSPLOWO2_02_FULL_45_11c TaxID=1802128 RepID=A0A1G2GYT7_9BACT|nr:MAG: hypothetical protein A3H64_00230 [Candidatus Ryanbacteria bacterium RIFCSPLOWO2_02_FULL_45_11c]